MDQFYIDFLKEYGVYGNLDGNFKSYNLNTSVTNRCTFIQDGLEKVIFTIELRLQSMVYINNHRASVLYPRANHSLSVVYSNDTIYVDTKMISKDLDGVESLPLLYLIESWVDINIIKFCLQDKAFENYLTIILSTPRMDSSHLERCYTILAHKAFPTGVNKKIVGLNILLLGFYAVFGKDTDRDSYEYKKWYTFGEFIKDNGDPSRLLKTGAAKIRNNVRSGLSSQLQARNDLDILSSIRKIIVPIDDNSSTYGPRSIHKTQKGFACLSEISEGKSAGLQKTMALTCIVSEVIDYDAFIDDFKKYMSKISAPAEILVSIDGLIVSMLSPIQGMRSEIKRKWKFVSMYLKDNIYYVRTVPGRPMRPMRYTRTKEIHLVDPAEIEHTKEYEEISDQYIFGISSSLLPYANHNQSARLIFATGMQKHMISTVPPTIYHSDYQQSFQVDEPMVNTIMYRTFKHYMENFAETKYVLGKYGRNCLVAITTFRGINQEDGIVLNKTSVDNGLFATMKYKKVEDYVDCLYDEYNVYGYVEKTSKKTTLDSIEKIHKEYIPELNMTREVRTVKVGDKIASRHAQKSIVCAIVSEEELPYAIENGKKIYPDIIMNPHAYPSRMTVGQLMESAAVHYDGTSFLKHDLSPKEYDMYYNGNKIKNKITMGYVYYAALRQQVDDKYFSRFGGPTSVLSKQPTSGRAREGGLRFGEMEIDSLISHNADKILERIVDQSDKVIVYRCGDCGRRVQKEICNACNSHKILKEKLPASFCVTENVLASLGIGVKRTF